MYDFYECGTETNGVINYPVKIETVNNHLVEIHGGIVDRDGNNKQASHLHVNNDFYFLENYLYFPINLFYAIKNRIGAYRRIPLWKYETLFISGGLWQSNIPLGKKREITLNDMDIVKIPEIFLDAIGQGNGKGHNIEKAIN
jgi:hypothetical protein